jgi:hypothetical protein
MRNMLSACIFYRFPILLISKHFSQQINEISDILLSVVYCLRWRLRYTDPVLFPPRFSWSPPPPTFLYSLTSFGDAASNGGKTPALPSCCRISLAPTAQLQLSTQGPGKTSQAKAATRLVVATLPHDNNGLTLHICTGAESLIMTRVKMTLHVHRETRKLGLDYSASG